MRRLFRKCLDVSIVVVAYAMTRGGCRAPCIRSLTRGYHRHCAGIDYEVLVVNNGSPKPFGYERVSVYCYLDSPSSFPAYALNGGTARAPWACPVPDDQWGQVGHAGVRGLAARQCFAPTGPYSRGARLTPGGGPINIGRLPWAVSSAGRHLSGGY